MIDIITTPEVLIALLTGLAVGGGWFFREVVQRLLLGWIHAPVFKRIDEMEDRIGEKIDKGDDKQWQEIQGVKTSIDHIRDNGAAFSDRVAGIEARQTQGAKELHDLRQDFRRSERSSG